MTNPRHHLAARFVVAALALSSASCSLFGGGPIGLVACPALQPNVNAFSASYTANPAINAKVRAFVQASKDMAAVSARVEQQAAAACRRMGVDLGVPAGQMQPRQEVGGMASGACEPVAARIDAILRQGIRLDVRLQPPVCQANAHAQGQCAAGCDTNQDAECRASCQAHADVHASCRPAVVQVNASEGAQMAGALVATLRANLPSLIEAQITLGGRLLEDAKVVAQVGANMPRLIGQAGAQAAACAGAAADMAAAASVRLQVSVRASASVSGRVGVR